MKYLVSLPLFALIMAGNAAQGTAAGTSSGPTYRVKNVAQVDLGDPAINAKYQAAMKKVVVSPPPQTKVPGKGRVVINTSRGPITLELDGKAAPLHVRSFLYLSSKKFFDGTVFHRRADLTGDGKGFIIQGGDPLSKTEKTRQFAGMGGPGYEIPREYNDLKHDKLVIAAARSNDPNSAGSQFYITQGAVHFLDEGDGYTVFGKVIGGSNVALSLQQGDKIKTVKLGSRK